MSEVAFVEAAFFIKKYYAIQLNSVLYFHFVRYNGLCISDCADIAYN